MNDECKTIGVVLQENGIIRNKAGNIIGRIATMEGVNFSDLHQASQQEDSLDKPKGRCPECGEAWGHNRGCHMRFSHG